jgi:guanylate kinase
LEPSLISHSGNVFVLSAPSGTGKSTLAKRLVQAVPDLDFSISFTTRAPRAGEVDGKDYFYVGEDTFDEMIRTGGLVEWVSVYGHKYGTGKAWITEHLASGKDILLDIETQGARNVHQAIPDAVMIFLIPPSAAELAQRLRGRGRDPEAEIKVRLEYARHELSQFPAYDYLVVNDTLDRAYRDLESIVLATRLRRERMGGTAERILEGF